MGLFSNLFGAKKQIPFETTIHLSIPLDDDEELDDLDLERILSDLDINTPDGVTIDRLEISAHIKQNDDC